MARSEVLGVRMTPEELAAIHRAASITNRRFSDVVRDAVRNHAQDIVSREDAADVAASKQLSEDELTICRKLNVRPSGYLSAKTR